MKKALITFWCLDGERRLTNEEDTRSIERLDFLLYIKENKKHSLKDNAKWKI